MEGIRNRADDRKRSKLLPTKVNAYWQSASHKRHVPQTLPPLGRKRTRGNDEVSVLPPGEELLDETGRLTYHRIDDYTEY